jgi:putative transposase
LLKKIKGLYCWLTVVFADSIYNRLPVLLACFLLGLTLIIVRRIAGTTGFVVIPRRWIVERTLGWFGRWRRLSKDYEELPEEPFTSPFGDDKSLLSNDDSGYK